MKWRDISLRWKILLIALLGPLLTGGILAGLQISGIQSSARNSLVAQSRAIVLMAEAIREEMAGKLEEGIIRPFSQLDSREQLLEAIPVITAIDSAAANAEEAGYTFRVPKESPRNPKNQPTPLESRILREIKEKQLPEKILITDGDIRYFRPIRLSEECLYCHGDPAGEQDPAGGTKEGWKTGEIHGAFEIISSLEETNASVRRAGWTVGGVTLGLLGILILITWSLLQTSLIRPLQQARDYLISIASGDLSQTLNSPGRDELGHMIEELNGMSRRLREMISSITEQSQGLLESAGNLDTVSVGLQNGASELSQKSQAVASASEEMSSNMKSISQSMAEGTENMSSVAAASEEMSTTIQDISSNTGEARVITEEAVGKAESASQRVQNLNNTAGKINEATETIAFISSQTNLLALNASIEAARAGQAQKGFAVVANEIKELAGESAAATEDIMEKVEGITQSTSVTAGEITAVTEVIQRVNEFMNTIASAVEEQSATTKDIAGNVGRTSSIIEEVNGNVSEATSVTGDIAGEISEVNQNAGEIEESSRQIRDNADQLNEMASRLQDLVNQFQLD